jgi:FkbM family methyltransferase
MRAQIAKVIRKVLRPPLHRPEVKLDYRVHGSDYGGWPLLTKYTPDAPLIFSFGVGRDVSFDLSAIEAFRATVHAFDPTPQSLAWVGEQTLPEKFHFHACGLADEDGEATFFPPENEGNVSFSSQPVSGNTGKEITAPVRRLQTIIEQHGMPDVIKMDIEGFEYPVLKDMLACDIQPDQLLVEFHHRMYDIPTRRTLKQIEALQEFGYRIFFVSDIGHEYGMVHKRCL